MHCVCLWKLLVDILYRVVQICLIEFEYVISIPPCSHLINVIKYLRPPLYRFNRIAPILITRKTVRYLLITRIHTQQHMYNGLSCTPNQFGVFFNILLSGLAYVCTTSTVHLVSCTMCTWNEHLRQGRNHSNNQHSLNTLVVFIQQKKPQTRVSYLIWNN